MVSTLLKQNRNIVFIALATALILMLPLVAMQFTDEVVWTPGDFLVAGAMLLGAGLTFELIVRKVRQTSNDIAYRAAVGIAVATGLILVTMNLAVGIIGSEDNPANLMYGGVLGVGVIGAIISRFQPGGMARTLFAMAFAQMLVGVIALIAGLGFTLILNGGFAALWVGSALLFRKAARNNN